jgi:hypothetical protein
MEKYKIGICELYNKHIHGFTDKLQGKYILSYELSLEEFMLDEYKLILDLIKTEYMMIEVSKKRSDVIRNYEKIIENNNYFSCCLFKDDEIEGSPEINAVIIKTGGIIWFQKKWKKRMNKNKEKIKKYKNLRNLRLREINGN